MRRCPGNQLLLVAWGPKQQLNAPPPGNLPQNRLPGVSPLCRKVLRPEGRVADSKERRLSTRPKLTPHRTRRADVFVRDVQAARYDWGSYSIRFHCFPIGPPRRRLDWSLPILSSAIITWTISSMSASRSLTSRFSAFSFNSSSSVTFTSILSQFPNLTQNCLLSGCGLELSCDQVYKVQLRPDPGHELIFAVTQCMLQ